MCVCVLILLHTSLHFPTSSSSASWALFYGTKVNITDEPFQEKEQTFHQAHSNRLKVCRMSIYRQRRYAMLVERAHFQFYAIFMPKTHSIYEMKSDLFSPFKYFGAKYLCGIYFLFSSTQKHILQVFFSMVKVIENALKAIYILHCFLFFFSLLLSNWMVYCLSIVCLSL